MRYLTKVMSKAKALRPECMSAWLEGQPPSAGGKREMAACGSPRGHDNDLQAKGSVNVPIHIILFYKGSSKFF